MTPNEILDKIRGAKILVIGDPIRDDYVFGRVERICPEAPIPVFVPESRESRPGGAANVARQLTALGCNVFAHFPQNVSVKTRYMAGQQMVGLRVDEDAKYGTAFPDNVLAAKALVRGLRPTAVVLSDYAKGWISSAMAYTVIKEAAATPTPVIVDPKGKDWRKYEGCTLICPNEKEYPWDSGGLFNVLHKKGARGMTLIQLHKAPVDIPATARHVYDVTGAGDTVVAVVAACVSVGASYLEAARLAALAAGFVVGEVGTAVCSHEKLRELASAW